MSDGITDFNRDCEFWDAKHYFDLAREQFTLDPNEDNGYVVKEAFGRLYKTNYGWRAANRILVQYGDIGKYLEYLRSINSMMAI